MKGITPALIGLFLLCSSFVSTIDKPAYVIYTREGKKVSYEQMIKVLKGKKLVFFGELHDNPISHWLELELTRSLYQNGPLMLGAEMIESDNQEVLNDYLQGRIDQKGLDTLARLWNNYSTNYKPLVDFAKTHQLTFIATNVPRRYAKMVNKKGFEALDSLPVEEKSWIAPLPIPFDPELASYKKILEMMGDHGTPSMVKAQAIKDATMAYFILKNIKPNTQFLHFNGAYHSDDNEGILWYIRQQNRDISYSTISTVEQEDLSALHAGYKNKADFIIVVDSDMTKTY